MVKYLSEKQITIFPSSIHVLAVTLPSSIMQFMPLMTPGESFWTLLIAAYTSTFQNQQWLKAHTKQISIRIMFKPIIRNEE